ncbi:MAG: WecB/TagA/CpsF family glycosyltransferase [Bosea sp. (in: a-proteobacteria)]
MQYLSAMQASSGQQTDASGSTRRIGTVCVSALTQDQALSALHDAIGSGAHRKLAFCNAHVVNLAASHEAFRGALADFLILPDGIGVDLGSRLLYGAAFPANLNGTDFTPLLLATAPRPLRVGLVGARPGIAEKAAAKLSTLDSRHQIMPLSHGFFDERGEQELLTLLAQQPVDILLVAFGNPRQEIWISQNIGLAHANLAIGVGALFDFLAGEVRRAPEWLRMLRLEWLYRLTLEPARLWRRYVLGNPAFLLRILRQKLTSG